MKKLIKYIPGVLFVAFAMTGCLKTNPMYEGFEDIKPVADIPLSNLSTGDSATTYTLKLLTDPNATVDTAIAVHLSAKNHIGDVTFKMALMADDPTFQTFLKGHSNLTLLPESLYTVDDWNVTIKDAGVLNVGGLKIKFKTGAVDANGDPLFQTHQYVIPIGIEDAGGYEIASNFRMIFLVIKVQP